MLSLIILQLPDSFILFQGLGAGHPLELCLGLSPPTLQIKALVSRLAISPTQGLGVCGAEPGGRCRRRLGPPGPKPTPEAAPTPPGTNPGGPRAPRSRAPAPVPRARRERPVSCRGDRESEGMRRMCWPRRWGRQGLPTRCPGAAAGGEARPPRSRGPPGCPRAAGTQRAGARPAAAAAAALTLGPDPSAVSSLILASAFCCWFPPGRTSCKEQKIASTLAREQGRRERRAGGWLGLLTKLGSRGPSCLFSPLWLAIAFPLQQCFVSLGLGTNSPHSLLLLSDFQGSFTPHPSSKEKNTKGVKGK